MEGKLVGVHKVTVKLADGSSATYYYAWRGKGAPRMTSKPGTKAFTLEYVRLTKDRQRTAADKTMAKLIDDFHASEEFKALAPKTRKDYERQLGLIRLEFGDMPVSAIEAQGSRKAFLDWRSTMADKKRAADAALGLLARVLSWAFDNEIIIRHPLTNFKHLHNETRADIIWSPDQITKLLTEGKEHIRNVALVALWTMQRQGDVLTMSTMAFDGERVSVRQSKTSARVSIPVADDILPLFVEAKESGRQRILVNSFGQNWTSMGFQASWRKELQRLKIKGVRFHDLRGTAISFAYANMDKPHNEKIKLIAEISGHSQADAETIIRRHYLAGAEVIEAIRKGTKKQ